ncbi:AI-2E family transporter [Jatrophihabitans endophyticus]|uniref:AI-2E family transporter n=1 Tax=Jatrophihabitans endophyticus TaxID=1206085 RepID=UPI0019E9C479|nr:AI-2E family transporter [Jatrophihabitans endophyticus]MBE7186826.1 AI-2E family transporter [Jatrophihabitans endophyticus]
MSTRRDASEAVSWGVRVAAAWTWRLLLIGFGIYVFLRIFGRVELIAFSFVLALFFTAVLHPLEKALRRIPGPRSISALLALLIGLAVLVGIGFFVAWQISNHSTQLSDQVSDLVTHTRNYLRNGPFHLKSKDLDQIAKNITNALKANKGALVSSAIETVRAVVDGLAAVLLILLSTFFLLRDGEQIWRWVLRLIPRAAQERVNRAGHVGWHTLGGYMRGQVTIALFHGIAVTIILLVLNVPLAAALGVLIFLGSFVPIIGLIVAGAFASAVALLEHGVTAAIVVAIAITILVQLEAHLLQPLIMSRSVEVHPLAIALSVLTGTVLAGIVGALLAVPLVAFLNATIHALRETPALPEGDSGFPVQHRESVNGDPVDGTTLPGDGDGDGEGTGSDPDPDAATAD